MGREVREPRVRRRRCPHARVPVREGVDNVREAAQELNVEYPIALDPDYEVWTAFGNHYWPAAYFADAEGRIRHHQFGEGGYDECERSSSGCYAKRELTELARTSSPYPATASRLRPIGRTFGLPRRISATSKVTTSHRPAASRSTSRAYSVPEELKPNSWAISGEWTVGGRGSVLNRASGSDRVPLPRPRRPSRPCARARGRACRFLVQLDGDPPGVSPMGWT